MRLAVQTAVVYRYDKDGRHKVQLTATKDGIVEEEMEENNKSFGVRRPVNVKWKYSTGGRCSNGKCRI